MTGSVVVTGLGAVTPYGLGMAALEAGLASGESAVSQAGGLRRALIPDLDIKAVLGAKGLRSVDRIGQLTLVACQDALANASYDAAGHAAELGVVLGTAFGGLSSITGFFRERLQDGPRLVTASNFGNIVMNAAASQVALRHGLTALNATLTSGSASGLDAVGWGLDFLREGRARALLVGGADELSADAFATLAALGWPAAGFVPGEGAVIWLLEREDDVAARGGQPLARVAAHAAAFDPGPLLGRAADASVAESTLRSVLELAGLQAADVDLVVTSECGLPDLDAASSRAIAAVFPVDERTNKFLAPKRWVGDTFAASGPLAGALAISRLAAANGPAAALVHAASPSGHQAAVVLKRLNSGGAT